MLEGKFSFGYGSHDVENVISIDLTNSTGWYGGFGIAYLTTHRKKMQTRDNRNGLVIALNYGQGKMDFSGLKVYSGRFHNSRSEEFDMRDIKYEYLDFKIGCEFIVMDVVRIEVFPLQIGGAIAFTSTQWPIKYYPALGRANNTNLGASMALHVQLDRIFSCNKK